MSFFGSVWPASEAVNLSERGCRGHRGAARPRIARGFAYRIAILLRIRPFDPGNGDDRQEARRAMTAEEEAYGEGAVIWARNTIERAVQAFLDQGILDTAVVEAKPAWGAPPNVLVAMLREHGARAHSYWLIAGGNVPFGYLPASVARTPREAARHFALRWQLEAARLQNAAASGAVEASGNEPNPARLSRQAEWLYRLVDDDSFWQPETLRS